MQFHFVLFELLRYNQQCVARNVPLNSPFTASQLSRLSLGEFAVVLLSWIVPHATLMFMVRVLSHAGFLSVI